MADGYARNFLIKRKLAVAQTQGSMQVLGRQQEEARLREEELEKEALKTKERLEKIVLECQIKTGNGGRSFGSTKQIAEQLAKEHDIHIDRRKILGHDSISSLGDSDLKVDLYRNKVIGVIHVHVSAK